jgi:hypothetical protein
VRLWTPTILILKYSPAELVVDFFFSRPYMISPSVPEMSQLANRNKAFIRPISIDTMMYCPNEIVFIPTFSRERNCVNK